VQQFSSIHFDDLEERVNQFMATRHAHTQLSHTHAVHQSCSYCYHPSHRIDDCTFLNHYVTETNKSTHENVQTTTILASEEKVVNKVEDKEKQSEPRPIPNLSKDKEVSVEAHFFITIPLETHHKPKSHFFNVSKCYLLRHI
jgi:Zn-finger protein